MVEQPAGALRARGWHGPYHGALLGDDRAGEAERLGEGHGARGHAAGDERDADPAAGGFGDGGQRALADDQVVADERAVDVDRDQADRQSRLDHQRLSGGRAARTDAPCEPVAACPKGPAGCGIASGPEAPPLQCSTAGPWSKPISTRAARRPGREPRRQSLQQSPHDRQPVGPAVERHARLERCGDGQPIDSPDGM